MLPPARCWREQAMRPTGGRTGRFSPTPTASVVGTRPFSSFWPGASLIPRRLPRFPLLPGRCPMRIAIYARVSTQRQSQTQTIEQQIDRLRSHLSALGERLADEDVFRDDGYSGATLRRPGLDRLRDKAALVAFDRIYVTDPDQLARNFVHQALLIEERQKHGCRVEFLDRPMSKHP